MVITGRDTFETLQQFSALIAAARHAAAAFALLRASELLAERLDDRRTIEEVLAGLESLLGRASRLP